MSMAAAGWTRRGAFLYARGMRRGIAIACALAGAAGVAALWIALGGGDEDLPPAPFPSVDAAAISAMTIARPDGEIRLARAEDGGWALSAPVSDRADQTAVENALGELARLEIGPQPVSNRAEDWARYEVAVSDVLTVTLSAGDKVLPALHLGRGRFIRIGNMSEVYEVFGFDRRVLALDLRGWRDRTILAIDPDAVTAMEVIAKDGTRARAERRGGLEGAGEPRPPPENVWVRGDDDEQAFVLDAKIVAEVFRRAVSLTAWGVDEGATFASAGLAPPALSLVLHTSEGDYRLAIGTGEGGFVPVGVAGKARVWLLRAPDAAALALGPRQWRKKTLIKGPADAIREIRAEVGGAHIDLIRQDGAWQGTLPDHEKLDAAAAQAYAEMLVMAEASQVAPDGAQLGTLAGTVTVAFATGAAVTVRVAERGDGTFLAASSARTDLLILDRHTADRLLPDPDTFARP